MGGIIGIIGGRKPDKDLADQLDAEERLLSRGYTKARCKSCFGTGLRPKGRYVTECWPCEGRGFYWRVPITK